MAVNRNIKGLAAYSSNQQVSWDTFVNSTTATTTFPSDTSVELGNGMAPRRRALLAFPVTGHFTAARLNIGLAATVNAAGNMVVLPVVAELAKMDGTDISYTNVDQSATDAWDEANALTAGAGTDPGGNTDNDVRCVFATSTDWLLGERAEIADAGAAGTGDDAADHTSSPSSGTLAAVFNRAQQAALEQGTDYFVVMIVHEDQTTPGAGGVNMTLVGHATGGPEIGGIVSDSPYDGLILAHRPILNLPTATTINVQLRLGDLNFNTGDEIGIQYSDDAADLPADSAATGGTAITPVDISAGVFGTRVSFTLSTATQAANANKLWAYRVVATIQGVTYYGAVHYAPLLVEAGTTFRSASFADDHWIVGINDVPDDAVEALQVQEASHARLRTYCDASSLHLRYLIAGGDCMDFAQLTSETIFPILTDGSGLSDSGTSIIATDQDDATHAILAWFCNSLAPFESVPILCALGNHAPYHWHAFSANNGAQTDVGTWILVALRDFGLIPPASVTTGYSQPTSREGEGNYAFVCGDTQVVVTNAGIDSESSGTINPFPGGTYPISLNDPSDWKLAAAIVTWFEDVLTGSTATLLDWYMHNGLMGTSVGSPDDYDRGDEDHFSGGFTETTLLPLVEESFPSMAMLTLGHDHNEDFGYLGTMLVRWHATPGEIGANNTANGGPFGSGFFGAQFHQFDAGRRGNAGVYLKTHTSSSMSEAYVATIIETSPQEWLTGPPSTAGGIWALDTQYNQSLIGLGFSDGATVRTLRVPRVIGGGRARGRGRGRRSWW